MRWTQMMSRDERHSICGRRSRVVPAPRCRCQASRILWKRRRWQQSPVSPGRSRNKS